MAKTMVQTVIDDHTKMMPRPSADKPAADTVMMASEVRHSAFPPHLAQNIRVSMVHLAWANAMHAAGAGRAFETFSASCQAWKGPGRGE